MNRCWATSLLVILACAALVGWFWSRGERFIAANGPTFDEGVHLAAGYSYWATGDFRLNSEDPPLLKLLWSLPLVLGHGPAYPREATAAGNHWHVADALLYRSSLPTRQLLDPARRVNLALGSALVLLVGWVAYRVYGSKLAAVAGCAFAASDPTLLALSCVLSTDIGVSLFALSTCYLLWEYAAAPSRGLLFALGVSLGLALAAKFSALGIVLGLGLAGTLFVWRGGSLALPGKDEPRGFRPAMELALRLGVIAIIALAATYAFINFPEWGKGLKFQLTRSEHGDGDAFLNGDISHRGWFHYFLVALPLKLPLGLLLAASVSAVSLVSVGSSRRNLFLIVPPLVFFALASYSRVNIGVRAVLPAVPFLYVLAAGLAVPACCRVFRWSLLAGCLAWSGIAAQQANPHEIAYFNEIAGEAVQGAKYLADSNLDWGQGLPALKEWMDAAGVDAVYLGYFGTDRPESHGIRFQALPGYGRSGTPGGEAIPADAPRHVLGVSVNHLLGLFLNDRETYAWLRGRVPTAILGGCIYIFDLTGDPDAIARVRSLPRQ
jgi:Dolichyl-phosphate-mannose-protein mannosyltransferase